MLPEQNIASKVVFFSDINLIPGVTLPLSPVPYCCPPIHPDSKTGILTRDSSLLLLQLHPLVLWTERNYCVLGRRVLHLVSPHLLSKDQIRVGYLPDATKEDVESLMSAELLLNQIAFATQSGSQAIFKASRKLDADIVDTVSPLLNRSVETIAKLFSDCSASTLFKINSKIDD